MPSLRYLHLDVFTARPFEGNQLAVFPEPGELSTPSRCRRSRARWHSRNRRSSSAGKRWRRADADLHARRGAADGRASDDRQHVRAGARGDDRAAGSENFVFELGVGPTPVSLEWNADGLSFAWMTQPLPASAEVIEDRRALAQRCGISEADLVEDLPVEEVSCGVPFLFVPLRTRTAVDAVSVDRRACSRYAAAPESPSCRCSSSHERPDRRRRRTTRRSTAACSRRASASRRIRRPAAPAVRLARYLLHHGVVDADAGARDGQPAGRAMGRPSRIHISIDSDDDMITRVRVGGESVLVGRGELVVG